MLINRFKDYFRNPKVATSILKKQREDNALSLSIVCTDRKLGKQG